MSKNKNRTPYQNPAEDEMIDTLMELDTFRNEYMKLLPQIRELLQSGSKAGDIIKKGSAVAAARLLNIAATDTDSGKALAAIKDILDRSEGKAKEVREVTHRLGEMKDEELDNLLGQELAQLEAMSGEDDE